MNNINYIIGHRWSDSHGKISTWAWGPCGEVVFGSMDDAQINLKTIQEKSPAHDWKIFVLEELL